MKIETDFNYFYKNETPLLVKASCYWVTPYNAGGLKLQLCDKETEEPIEVSFDVDAFEDLELQAIEELMNKKDEMELDFFQNEG